MSWLEFFKLIAELILATALAKFCFIALNSLTFGTVREFVGKIKYAYEQHVGTFPLMKKHILDNSVSELDKLYHIHTRCCSSHQMILYAKNESLDFCFALKVKHSCYL